MAWNCLSLYNYFYIFSLIHFAKPLSLTQKPTIKKREFENLIWNFSNIFWNPERQLKPVNSVSDVTPADVHNLQDNKPFGVSDSCGISWFSYEYIWSTFVNPSSPAKNIHLTIRYHWSLKRHAAIMKIVYYQIIWYVQLKFRLFRIVIHEWFLAGFPCCRHSVTLTRATRIRHLFQNRCSVVITMDCLNRLK